MKLQFLHLALFLALFQPSVQQAQTLGTKRQRRRAEVFSGKGSKGKTASPSSAPSPPPSVMPSSGPTATPTASPTASPSSSPTASPSSSPTASPTPAPTMTSSPTECGDNPGRFYVPGTAGTGMRTCEWVNRMPGARTTPWRCNRFPEAADNCKASCGLCDEEEG